MTSEEAQHFQEQLTTLNCVLDSELVELTPGNFAVQIEYLNGLSEVTPSAVVDAYAKLLQIKAKYFGEVNLYAVPGANGEPVNCDRMDWVNWQRAGGPKRTMQTIREFGDIKGIVWFCGVSNTLDGTPKFWEVGFLDPKNRPIWKGSMFETREMAVAYIENYNR